MKYLPELYFILHEILMGCPVQYIINSVQPENKYEYPEIHFKVEMILELFFLFQLTRLITLGGDEIGEEREENTLYWMLNRFNSVF